MATRARLLSAASLFLFACDPTARLQSFPLDDVDAAMKLPTGALERTDALGLAYTVLGTQRFLRASLVAADQLPGLRLASAYAAATASRCARREDLRTAVDYGCLGFPSGELDVRALSRHPNDNGDYALELSGIDLAEGEVLDGSSPMRVEGVANPTEPERVVFAPVATLEGFPRFFTDLEHVAVRISTAGGEQGTDCVTTVLEDTFVFQVLALDEAALSFAVRDARNLWTCRSELEGRRIRHSECRTPVGQGDYARLRF